MSISIDVDSIVTPREHRTFGPPSYQDYQYADLRALCRAFGWSSVPWPEPSPVRGETATSCSSTRYYRLLGVARAHVRKTVFRVYNEECAPELTPEEAEMFPHLLIRATWSNYYLPVDFEHPVFFEATRGTVSAGSPARLQRELTRLAQVIATILAPSNGDTSNLTTTAPEAINGADDLCELLISATRESIQLNLPLLLHG